MTALTGKTRINLLIGSPIAQVLAPGWLTERMQNVGYDGLLVPIQILPERLDAALPELMAMPNVDSILVTLPHKFRASRHCAALSPRATILGAINAMRRMPDGRWHGDNFDGAGMLAGLRNAGHDVEGKAVYVAGAGGAGSSIAVSMLEAGASRLMLHDLDTAKENALLDLLERHYPGRVSGGSGDVTGFNVVINASYAGFNPADPLPIDPAGLVAGTVVADVITDPVPTKLLREAAKLGCPTRDGTHMLEGQMQLLFEFMTGRPPESHEVGLT
ncbi:shikimate dehydrogenase [Pelagibacterium sp. H642]|uniref:shikimate dehydrogenase family protein n=1 Tax=Pelagibacterium sp. H642 TaxID=1881069 RepID=UPI002814D49A|nr:shikimate dehydrogenase [Pelagibacterium sp. H642]WMT91892.1 shikimate dehydrogenase [Pelagibacterium sp. H642]